MPFESKYQPGCAIIGSGGSARITGLKNILLGILLCVLLKSPGEAFGEPVPEEYSLTLGWNPSPSPEIVGCHLYYGTVSGEYTNTVVVGNVTTVTVLGLSSGVTYYFAITAMDASGQESDFSNEICYRQELSPLALPGAQLQFHRLSDGQVMLGMTGTVGHTYDIEATEDFTTWTVIGTVTIDPMSSPAFTDPDAPNYAQRFYRTRDLQR